MKNGKKTVLLTKKIINYQKNTFLFKINSLIFLIHVIFFKIFVHLDFTSGLQQVTLGYNRFDNRQVNSSLVNQEVMSTRENKFLLFIKIRSIKIR